jgi:hypothetical protein
MAYTRERLSMRDARERGFGRLSPVDRAIQGEFHAENATA